MATLTATYWGLIADVGNPKTPPPLASANIGNGDPPSPPKTCRRLKWMVPKMIFFSVHNLAIASKVLSKHYEEEKS